MIPGCRSGIHEESPGFLTPGGLENVAMTETTMLGDDFSLEFISARLTNFKIPEAPFEPAGNWQLDYGVYTFSTTRQGPTPGGLVGRMTLTRQAVDESQADLMLAYEKNGPGTVQKVAATMRCGTDALSTPVRWQYSAEVVDSDGKRYEDSRLAKRAVATDGRIEIIDDHSTRQIALNGPFTVNWALWDAVMRMPRGEAAPLPFTMLDHFDQVKRGQSLAFRKSAVVALGRRRTKEQNWQDMEKGRIRQTRWVLTDGHDVTLHAFEQLGEGIVPWVYWTDDRGRLLFVVAGLEVYVLDSWQEQ
mgnify:FL=1